MKDFHRVQLFFKSLISYIMTLISLVNNLKAMGLASNTNKEWANGHIGLGTGIFVFKALLKKENIHQAELIK